MKVDLVYKLNNSSKNNNLELRYSLRSVETFFEDINNVWIIGHCPDFIDKSKVGFLSMPDTFGIKNKDANIILKLAAACSIKSITDEFLNMSDDFIFLKHQKLEYFKTPQYNNNLVKNEKDYASLKLFDKRIIKTRELLRNHGFTQNVYEAHIPYLIDKTYAAHVFQYPFHQGVGYLGNTIYFNRRGTEGRQQSINTVLRLNQISDSLDKLDKYDFLNYNYFAEGPNLFNVLGKIFTKPSKWEKF